MFNPYLILEVSLNASKKEIIRGKISAMKGKKYTLQEIHLAEKQLLNPTKRLESDFMLYSNIRAIRPKIVKEVIIEEKLNLDDLNENAFDSLKLLNE